jgi:hypothetical protein
MTTTTTTTTPTTTTTNQYQFLQCSSQSSLASLVAKWTTQIDALAICRLSSDSIRVIVW